MSVILSLILVPTKGLVVLLRSEYMKEVLSKPDIFPKTNVLNLFFPLFGNGLATATGESHRFQRKFFAKPFSMVHMKHYVPVFNKHAGILTEVNIAINTPFIIFNSSNKIKQIISVVFWLLLVSIVHSVNNTIHFWFVLHKFFNSSKN